MSDEPKKCNCRVCTVAEPLPPATKVKSDSEYLRDFQSVRVEVVGEPPKYPEPQGPAIHNVEIEMSCTVLDDEDKEEKVENQKRMAAAVPPELLVSTPDGTVASHPDFLKMAADNTRLKSHVTLLQMELTRMKDQRNLSNSQREDTDRNLFHAKQENHIIREKLKSRNAAVGTLKERRDIVEGILQEKEADYNNLQRQYEKLKRHCGENPVKTSEIASPKHQEDSRYYHFRTPGAGDATVCVERIKKGDQYYYHMGVAFCSPRDNFSRATGRSIAQGRLRTLRAIYKGQLASSDIKTLGLFTAMSTSDATGTVIRAVLDRIPGPGWYKKFCRILATKEIMEKHMASIPDYGAGSFPKEE